MKQQKQPGEEWHDWHVGSLRRARLAAPERWHTLVKFHLKPDLGLAGHCSRGDAVASAMMKWRNLAWWRVEQSIPACWGDIDIPSASTDDR